MLMSISRTECRISAGAGGVNDQEIRTFEESAPLPLGLGALLDPPSCLGYQGWRHQLGNEYRDNVHIITNGKDKPANSYCLFHLHVKEGRGHQGPGPGHRQHGGVRSPTW